MKGFIPAFLLLFINSFCQQLLVEDFNYPEGTELSSRWNLETGSIRPRINEGNLTYSNYISDVNSNRLFLNQNEFSITISAAYNSVSTSSVYCSFLINLNSSDNLTIQTNDFGKNEFFSFGKGSLTRGFLIIKKNSANSFSIGVANKDLVAGNYINKDLLINTTHLIVVCYSFSSGTETFKLWINPILSDTEPLYDYALTISGNLSAVSNIKFYQRAYTGDMYIDAIRVATTWEQAPLPVELSSFNAEVKGSSVKLLWSTKTEVNNYGFEIERSYDKTEWHCIGFVNGAGDCNSERYYELIDENVRAGRSVYYRLKQIDTDGKYNYSDVVEAKLELKGYELYQNYPNPFNPDTKIEWMQEREGTAVIRIFDAAGKLLRRFAENRAAGLQYMIFSAEGLTSGIYYYELECGGVKLRKSMMLLK